MKYKVGDEVVLRNERDVFGGGNIVMIDFVESIRYRSERVRRGYFDDDDIDHEKTAELNELGELEKIVAEKNNVSDPVNHPPHYNQGEIETIDIIKELTRGYSGFEAYLVGNVIKYIARANFKGNKQEDLEKAEFYYKRLLEDVEGDNETQSE